MAPTTTTAAQVPGQDVEMAQPAIRESMNPNTPPPQQQTRDAAESEEMHLRGGEACPGRFCFIIPCPLPCNFCII
ncbi:hypothetical protein BP5796_00901 [Coleophoma crateriformis]|uniref:Uncharacterized protein n=1 Tax=Coleophoma crateriformis TaxID=565419 RepID=A0A3D8TBI3_9HELO|nr:hypothetical protein BP5796_00901 [Coleophoma crateriformis]